MRLALATAGLPAYGNHGGAQTCMGIVRTMVAAGHEVSVLSLFSTSSSNPYLDHRNENEAQLGKLGVKVLYVDHDYTQLIERSRTSTPAMDGVPDHISRAYPWALLRDRTQEILDAIHPDALFCYHFEPLAATYGIRCCPKLAGIGDPTHLPGEVRCRAGMSWGHPRRTAAALYAILCARRQYIPCMKALLRDCRAVGAFAGHYAQWLRRKGFPDAHYLRTPLADPLAGASCQKARERHRRDARTPKVLLIGDLGSTSTSSGLRLFSASILPRLTARLGNAGLEAHLVGRGKPPEDIVSALSIPAVKLRGRVDPPDDEFLSADLLLVPTPVDLGIRVRILTAFSFGCPVVAHSANAAGIPELVDSQNCLLSSTGRGLANAVTRVIQEDGLRSQLEAAGRTTFESAFSEGTAGARIVRLIESVNQGVPKRSPV